MSEASPNVVSSSPWVVCWVCVVGLLTVDLSSASDALVQAVRAGDQARTAALIEQGVDVNAANPDGATALHWAAHVSDLDTLRLLLQAGASANVSNVYGVTPLALACVNANGPIVEALLQSGADPNLASISGESSLMNAARAGNPEVVDALLSAGADINATEATRGQTALMWAASEGHSVIVRQLSQVGVSVDARTESGFTALMFAARSGDVESARTLLVAGADLEAGASDNRNALIVAAGSSHTPLVEFLLDQGADPNVIDENGVTPLHAAVWGNFNNVEMVQLLLARGAHPNARVTRTMPQRLAYTFFADIFFRTPTYMSLQGASPLALAAAQGDAAAMRALAAGGADVTIPLDNGGTPLMLAAGLGWTVEQSGIGRERPLAAVQVAIELGADVNAQNQGGRTALHGAANNGVGPVIRFLVARGADINAVDGDGWTPLWTAQHAQLGSSVLEQPESIEVLRELGALDIVPEAAVSGDDAVGTTRHVLSVGDASPAGRN